MLLLLLLLAACRQEPPPAPEAAPPPGNCLNPPDILEVLGYYSLDSCFIRLNTRPRAHEKWCQLPTGEMAAASCPGWEAFIAILDEARREFTVEAPFEVINTTGFPVQLWHGTACPYPGAFDNAAAGRLPGDRYYAVMLLSEEHLACLRREGGFFFRLEILQSKY